MGDYDGWKGAVGIRYQNQIEASCVTALRM